MAKLIDYDIIIDTREQKPLPFRGAVKKKLDFGDYGAEVNGELLPIVFDRKNPSDAYSTLTVGHDRFKREMERAYDNGFKLIVIVECSYTTFVNRKFEGAHNIRLPFGIIEKILHTMQVRYPSFEVVFCTDRSEMQRYIKNYFNALVKEYNSL